MNGTRRKSLQKILFVLLIYIFSSLLSIRYRFKFIVSGIQLNDEVYELTSY